MSSTINGQKIPLGKLFGDEFYFTIPDYQRPYSWKKEHCEQLIDDLENSDKEKEYFLGTVILQETSVIGNGRKYDIIDGQQRITTLQILFAVMRDLFDDKDYRTNTQELICQAPNRMKNIPERVRLETTEKRFFKDKIQTEYVTKNIKDVITENDAQQRIIHAIEIFNERLSGYSQNKLQKLGEFLLQKCVIVYVSTTNFDDAYRLFIVINDRGLQLRRVDILKAQNLDPNSIPGNDERKEYAKIWEQMERDLGSDNFEQLFYYIRTILIKDKANEDLLKEFNNLVFGKNKLTKGKEFINYVEKFKNIYERLILDREPFTVNSVDKITFNNLIRIMNDYLYSNEWLSALLFYYHKFNENGLLVFLFKLEKKFVIDWVTGLTLGKRISNIYNILREIEKSDEPNHLFQTNVFEYDKDKFSAAIRDPNFYWETYCKYILAKLDFLTGENNVERTIFASSVEHVLPQNPKVDSNWNNIFTDTDKQKWTNHIANLVLLSKRKNSSASNLDFENKKEKYFKGRITDLPSSIKILKYEKWDLSILLQREKEILQMLEN